MRGVSVVTAKDLCCHFYFVCFVCVLIFVAYCFACLDVMCCSFMPFLVLASVTACNNLGSLSVLQGGILYDDIWVSHMV